MVGHNDPQLEAIHGAFQALGVAINAHAKGLSQQAVNVANIHLETAKMWLAKAVFDGRMIAQQQEAARAAQAAAAPLTETEEVK